MHRSLFSLLVLAASVLPAWSAAPPRPGRSEPLPRGAILRIGTDRLRHGGVIRAVAFSPKGDKLASASHDHTVSVWQLAPLREIHRFRGHAADVSCVAFSADGRLVASGGADGVVRLWSVHGATSGLEIRVFVCKAESIEALAFSPDGKVLATGGDDGVLRLYDMGKGIPKQTVVPRQMSQDRAIRCLAWSADGKVIATNAAKHSVAVWDVDKGSLLQTFGDEQINALAFAPGGRHLITWETGGTLRLWDAGKGTQIRSFGASDETSSGGDALIYQLAFSKDGKNVYCGATSGTIDVWDPSTGKRRMQMTGHRGRVPALALSPRGGLLASGGGDGTIRLWDVAKGKERTQTQEPVGAISSLSLDPKGKQLALVLDAGQVQLWDRTGTQLRAAFKGNVLRAVFGKDGLVNLIDREGRLGRWDPKTEKTTILEEPGPPVTGLALSADGKTMVTTHRDGTLWLRDSKGKRLRLCQGKERRVTAVLGPDGEAVAAVGQLATVSLWNGKTGKPQYPLGGHRGGSLCAAFSADGNMLASGGRDRMLRVWDLRTRKELRTPSGHIAWVCAVAFSPDGKLLASATLEGDLHVWAVRSGRLLADLDGHRGPITGLEFADSKTLVSAGRDASVIVWDVTNASEGKVPAVALTAAQREKFWGLLLSDDPAVGSVAIQRLARDRAGVVAYLRTRVALVDGKKINRFLADLDANDYKTREAAFKGLALMGRYAEGSIRQALAKKPNLEKHRRLEDLLELLTNEKLTSEHLRALRVVEVLEMVGTPEARKVLQTLAGGAADAELTRKAKSALGRMGKK